MKQPRLSKLELRIMEAFWERGTLAIREVQEGFPQKKRPAYTTIQTMVNRLEAKGALRRSRKIGNAHIYEAVISRSAAQRRLIAEFLSLFGGRMHLIAQLVETGNLTFDDLHAAEKLLDDLGKKGKQK